MERKYKIIIVDEGRNTGRDNQCGPDREENVWGVNRHIHSYITGLLWAQQKIKDADFDKFIIDLEGALSDIRQKYIEY